MAAPAAPLTDPWAKARRDARIHALLMKYGGDVDRVANIGWYCVTWSKADVLRVRRDYPPHDPPAVVPPPPKPGRPRMMRRDDDKVHVHLVPVPREEESAPGWPALPPEPEPVSSPLPVAAESAPLELPEVPAVALTNMHMQVLRLTCQGLTNKGIARELLIAEDTVKSHLRAIFRAFGVGDRTTLVVRVLTFEQQPVLGVVGRSRSRDVEPEPEPEPAPTVEEAPQPRKRGPRGSTEVTDHGKPRGYGQHRRLGVPFPEDTGGEPCGCRKAHSAEVSASHERKHGRR